MSQSSGPPSGPLPPPALLRALAANPSIMADLISDLTVPVSDADALLALMGTAARAAVRLLDGVEWAGVTTQFDSAEPMTAAHTDDRVLVVDERQYEVHDGPCLRAMRTRRRVRMNVDEIAAAWPHLGEAAAAAGVRSVLALPLRADDAAGGALNLYGPGALGDLDEDLLTVLTGYLDLGLRSYRRHQPAGRITDLRAALDRQAAIDQAVGILMVTDRLDQDGAKDLLRQQATAAGIEPALLARYLVDRHRPQPD